MAHGKRTLIIAGVGSAGVVLITTIATVAFFKTGILGVLRNNFVATFLFLLLYFSIVRVFEIYERMYRLGL